MSAGGVLAHGLRVQLPSGPPISQTESHRESPSRDGAIRFQRKQAPGALPNRAGANSAWCSSNTLRSGRRERRCNSCRADQFPLRSVAQSLERLLAVRKHLGTGRPQVFAFREANVSFRETLGETWEVQILPFRPFELLSGITVVLPPVKRAGAGATPA